MKKKKQNTDNQQSEMLTVLASMVSGNEVSVKLPWQATLGNLRSYFDEKHYGIPFVQFLSPDSQEYPETEDNRELLDLLSTALRTDRVAE